MPKNNLLLSPLKLCQDELLHINCKTGHFHDLSYRISTTSGKLIRKGKIDSHRTTFSLSMSGIPDGTYLFEMDNEKHPFTVINSNMNY